MRKTGLSAISVEALVLRGDDVERRLSARLFADGELLREAAEDIRALQEGRPPPSRKEPEPANEWDDRLEEELDAFD